jgi:hypothetical protein
MSYFWSIVTSLVAGFVLGTIWGRWLQSAAIDKIIALLKPAAKS